MKKLISLCLALALAVSAFGVSAFALINGDVDDSKDITAADARSILRYAVGLDKPTDAQRLAADLDMDGTVTAADARTALRIAVGLETTDKKQYANEYEILSGGHFYVDVDVSADGETHNIVMAVTEKSTYLCMKISASDAEFSDIALDITIPILFAANGKTYLIDYKNGLYSEFPYEEMGMTEEDLAFGTEANFTLGQPLPKSPSGKETVYGVSCDVYTITSGKVEQKIYLNGRKLIAIREKEESGAVTNYKFNAVSLTVPQQYVTVPNNFENVEDPTMLLLLLMMGGELS